MPLLERDGPLTAIAPNVADRFAVFGVRLTPLGRLRFMWHMTTFHPPERFYSFRRTEYRNLYHDIGANFKGSRRSPTILVVPEITVFLRGPKLTGYILCNCVASIFCTGIYLIPCTRSRTRPLPNFAAPCHQQLGYLSWPRFINNEIIHRKA
jgi:hypothetical protein